MQPSLHRSPASKMSLGIIALAIISLGLAGSIVVTGLAGIHPQVPWASTAQEVQPVETWALAPASSAGENDLPGQICRLPSDVPYLGVTYLPITASWAGEYEVPADRGALVTAVAPNSPAWRFGIQPGDILLALDGQTISTSNPLVGILLQHDIGDVVDLVLLHAGEERRFKIMLGDKPRN